MDAVLHTEIDWPYDDAMTALHAARDVVRAGGPMHIFVGSHREEVVTLGRHAPEDQLVRRAALDARGVLVRRVERGGGATAHGPGQLVLYPVVSLPRLGLTIPRLTDLLERLVVEAMAAHGIVAKGDPERRGVYVGGAKVGSIGFRVEEGVVTHGAAFNIENDTSLFELIAPCGFRDLRTTSLASELAARGLAARLDLAQEGRRLARRFADACMLALAT
jgi:lipoate-protein ligase B